MTVLATPPSLTSGIGSPNPMHDILLDAHRISVTKNLEIALRSLAKECGVKGGCTTTLWVDALCIDQRNVNERAHQVS